jgi:poly(3-hydroxybutyrate) depolymerase
MVETPPSGQQRLLGMTRAFFVTLCLTIAVVIAAVGVLVSQQWTGEHVSPLAQVILSVVIVNGPVPIIVYALTLIGLLFLLARRPTRRRVLTAILALVGGAIIGESIFLVTSGSQIFGLELHWVIGFWVVVVLSTIALAIVSFWHSSAWRRLGNAVVIVLAVVTGVVGVNADFGLDPTLATLVGLSSQKVLALPNIAPGVSAPAQAALAPLYTTWHPPADMPTAGQIGQVTIPGTLSGFTARPAGLYLPPAALVKNPPPLPLVIMMMGEPGNPDPQPQATVLDQLAARHGGLAPIVLVPDQLGSAFVDSLCLNTKQYGNIEQYITQDVVNWARTHLHIIQDPATWTIAGYSSGGECAVSFAAKYPSIWHNVISVSGEIYAGWDTRNDVVAKIFHGSWADYSKTWPVNIMAGHRYSDMVGIFTVGSNDPTFRPQARELSDAAKAAGWKSTVVVLKNVVHGEDAVLGGLTAGYTQLYPRLGLSAPASG